MYICASTLLYGCWTDFVVCLDNFGILSENVLKTITYKKQIIWKPVSILNISRPNDYIWNWLFCEFSEIFAMIFLNACVSNVAQKESKQITFTKIISPTEHIFTWTQHNGKRLQSLLNGSDERVSHESARGSYESYSWKSENPFYSIDSFLLIT